MRIRREIFRGVYSPSLPTDGLSFEDINFQPMFRPSSPTTSKQIAKASSAHHIQELAGTQLSSSVGMPSSKVLRTEVMTGRQAGMDLKMRRLRRLVLRTELSLSRLYPTFYGSG